MKNTVFMALILGAFVLTACGNGPTPASTDAPVPPDYAGLTNPLGSDAAVDGAQVFKNNCAACHGPQGHGDGPAGAALNPQPKNLAELQIVAGDDFLFWRISEGVGGTSMIGWRGILTDEQIWHLVSFIRTLK